MKRKTIYFIKVIIADNDLVDEIHREFSRIQNVRKFAKKYKGVETLRIWKLTGRKNKGKASVKIDCYYGFNPSMLKGLSKLKIF